MDTLSAISTRLTPQSRRAAADQSPNSAGGYTFTLDDAARLRRFLILGVDGGTYYTSAQDLAIDNLEVLERMAAEAPRTLVDTIVEVSTSGAAPRQNPALFALAYATSVPQAREDALAALPRVVRTGSHLFTFAGHVEQFRGWGRGL
uniref:TROVE domain-containing protein n=1 Tax=uncultured Campylobacter sp. TaxID=218934 RepID=UPI0026033945